MEEKGVAGVAMLPRQSSPPPLASSVAFRALSALLVLAAGLQIAVVWRHQNRDELLLGRGAAVVPSRQQPADADAAAVGNEELGQRERRGRPSSSSPAVDVPSLLRQAGIPVPSDRPLPTPSEISSMYGPDLVVLNLPTSCPRFRSSVPARDRGVAPAGLFNAGTNMLATLLRRNCYIPEKPGALEDRFKSGMLFQAPWGKHNPASWRFRNVAEQGGKGIVQADVLPVVVVRDPVAWMTSMCRHPYGVRLGANCEGKELRRTDGPVSVPYKPRTNVTSYDSPLDLWRVWHEEWLSVDFPSLMVRFEDLLFRPEEVVQAVCDCAGGTRRGELYIKEESAKGEIGPHKGGSGYLESVIRYGNATARRETLRREEDRAHVRSDAFAHLLDMFHYSVESL